jgi:sigma54-dependent transcription regulator
MKFYDVGLIEKSSGNLAATWAGVTKDLPSALYNVLRRAKGKIDENDRVILENNLGVLQDSEELSEARAHYGYVVRSVSEVKSF